MKKIIIVLLATGLNYVSVSAQQKNETVACGLSSGKVCKTSDKGAYCYKTPYAQNFKVCKGYYGYFICCETPNAFNTTNPRLTLGKLKPHTNEPQYEAIADNMQETETHTVMAPQSQSYPSLKLVNAGLASASGNGRKEKMRVCYGGDNVAELNQAAYNGCPTPAYDGPERNNERNINSNNTVAYLAPIGGNGTNK